MSNKSFVSLMAIMKVEKGTLQSSKCNPGEFTFITASDDFKTHDEYYFDTEALCFAFGSSGSLGKIHYFNGKFIASDLMFVIRPTIDFMTKVNLKYYYYYFKMNRERIIYYWNQGTSKISINLDDFNNLIIPLPPLEEQNRIVAIIDSIQEKANRIKQLRAEQDREIRNLKYSIFEKLFKEYENGTLNDYLFEQSDQVIVNVELQYKFAGLYGFGKGLFVRGMQKGNETTYKTFNMLHENQIVLSQPKGWEGAIALVSKEFEGLFLSPVYSTFVSRENTNIKFVMEYLSLSSTWQKLLDVSKGIGARRNSIYPQYFLGVNIPIVTIAEQNKIVEMLDKVNKLSELYNQQLIELNNLLPNLLDKAFRGEM